MLVDMNDHTAERASSAGRNYVLLAAPFVVLLVVYLPALIDLVENWWHDDNYSHGFLVPLVSAGLVWSKREQLARIPHRIDRLGLLVVLAGAVLFVLANGMAEYFTLRFSFVLTLFGMTWYLFGRQFVRTIWFAFFFLLFMIPIPYVIYYAIAFPMQTLATKITVWGLNVIGMAAVRQGNIIHITGHSLEVAEACSGIRSLVSLVALGALYAYVTQKRFIGQVIVFVSTVPVAIVGNVVRVFVTSVLVATGTEAVTQEPLHSIMGLLVFVVAFILLSIISIIVRKVFK